MTANQNTSLKGQLKLKCSKAISTWFMILFFLFAGVSAFGVSLGGRSWGILTGIFALGSGSILVPRQISRITNPIASPWSKGRPLI